MKPFPGDTSRRLGTMKHWVLLLGFSVPGLSAAWSTLAAQQETPTGQIAAESPQETGFPTFLEDLLTDEPTPWPPIVSAVYETPLSAAEANRQRELEHLARLALRGLDDYREPLSDLPGEELATVAETLLDLSDAAAAGGGYVNLLVADALNRVLFVELTTRLVRLGSAPPELAAAVDRLAGYEIAPRKLVAMAEEELGRSVPGVDEAEADSGARGVFYHLFQEVGGDLAHLAGLRSAEELAGSTVYQLLETPNLGRLLIRYWQTDYGIHIRLPLLARYLHESGGGVERYDYEHVRNTLDLSSEEVRQSYDSIIHRTRRTAVSGVLGLVEEVRSGGIDAFVAFGEAAPAPPSDRGRQR